VCHSGGLFIELTDHDKTDVGAGVVCSRLEDLTDASKIAYYALRIARLFPVLP